MVDGRYCLDMASYTSKMDAMVHWIYCKSEFPKLSSTTAHEDKDNITRY